MSYLDNVDWDELNKQAMIKAIDKAFELVMDKTIPITDAAPATKILFNQYKDEIWLMGPVPMKKGYKPPVVNFDFMDFL